MKKILVPTDFSENASSAFLYAMELAENLNAMVTVVHIYHPSANHLNEFYLPSDDEIQKISKERLDQFVTKHYSKNIEEVIVATMVEQKLIIGFAADKLVEMSKSGEYDLIVMGATGSTGVLEKVFGKVSLYVAQRAVCPVLLIPVGVLFRPIKSLMYASEYESADSKVLVQIGEFSNLLNAKIHLVHVYDKTESDISTSGDHIAHFLLEKAFQLKAPWLQFKMDSIKSDTVAHGLETYAQEHNMDWMILVKPQRKFWQRLLHMSKTNEIIMNPQIPLMVMH
ncbi:MAG: universal stress protein [Saprospiraceae bacterium]